MLAVGSYKCSEGTCARHDIMLWTADFNGELKCEEDNASCILDGERQIKGMFVWGTGAVTLILRAISFQDGEFQSGGGVDIGNGAIVTIELCVFSNCHASGDTYSGSSFKGGGAIYVDGGEVNLFGTSFNSNSVAYSDGFGDGGYGEDILILSGTITIHDTCPSPYSSNTPTQGKKITRIA